MRRTLLILLAALSPIAAGAQPGPVSDRQQLPADVRREVADKWNRQNALRSSERLEIEAGQEVTGDVAVQRGPLVIAGHIVGSVLAINSDVVLRPTARIDGNLLVVGGEVDGRNSAFIGGSTRIYRQSLLYRTEGDRVIPSDSGMESLPSPTVIPAASISSSGAMPCPSFAFDAGQCAIGDRLLAIVWTSFASIRTQ